MHQFTFIDLFAGCGGMSLGFEQAGFKSLLAIDSWEEALVTYKYNCDAAQTLCTDIESIDIHGLYEKKFETIPVDLIIGGPPCQGFSIAGKRIVEDKRNSLYKSFVRFVEVFRPKAFVMENVPNIFSMANGAIKDAIIEEFTGLGYKVECKTLLAADYGVPQNRRRAFFVGLSSGKSFVFPERSIKTSVTAEEALSDLEENSIVDGTFYSIPARSSFQKLMRIDSRGIYNHQITQHTQKTIDTIALVPDGGNYKDLPLELQGTRKVNIAWTRLNSQRPSFTIDTGHNHHFHYKYNRVPTVRESARLQSFPDTFVFKGEKGSQLRQVGNAVPPLLAKAIAQALTDQID
jgi:DNA (cytosine-5-)-methyltransferase